MRFQYLASFSVMSFQLSVLSAALHTGLISEGDSVSTFQDEPWLEYKTLSVCLCCLLSSNPYSYSYQPIEKIWSKTDTCPIT